MNTNLGIILKNGETKMFKMDKAIAESIVKQHMKKEGVVGDINSQEAFSVNLNDVFSIQIKSPVQEQPRIIEVIPEKHGQEATIDKPLSWDPRKERKPKQAHETPINDNPFEKDGVRFSREDIKDLESEFLKKALYKIECKCGAEYFCTLYENSEKCVCRECKEKVYFDKDAAVRYGDNEKPAMLMTNKYYVDLAGTSK